MLFLYVIRLEAVAASGGTERALGFKLGKINVREPGRFAFDPPACVWRAPRPAASDPTFP